MRYDDQDRESSNVEDRRGQSGGGGMFRFPGGFGGGRGRRVQIPFPMGRGGRGGGFSITTLIIIGIIMWALGFNPLTGGRDLPASLPQKRVSIGELVAHPPPITTIILFVIRLGERGSIAKMIDILSGTSTSAGA